MSPKSSTPRLCVHCGMPITSRWTVRFCSPSCHNEHKTKPAAERFWAKVDKNGPVPTQRPELGPCWVWIGGKDPDGYGRFTADTKRATMKPVKAHRFAYSTAVGPIPSGMFVCHKCDNPPCCRPSHLFLGTNQDNMADAVSKGRMASGDRNVARLHPERMAKGERHGRAKLRADQVEAIRATATAGGTSHRKIAAIFRVSKTTIGQIIRREIWA